MKACERTPEIPESKPTNLRFKAYKGSYFGTAQMPICSAVDSLSPPGLSPYNPSLSFVSSKRVHDQRMSLIFKSPPPYHGFATSLSVKQIRLQ